MTTKSALANLQLLTAGCLYLSKKRQSLTVIFQLITAGNLSRQSLPLASLQLMTAGNILTKGLSAYIDQKTTMSASEQFI